MIEQLERREIVKKETPSIRDNLAIETSLGLLDVRVDGEAVTQMLLKGVRQEDEDKAHRTVERMEIFFGKRSFPEVLSEKLKEVMEKRNFSEGVSGGAGNLGELAFQIEDGLIDRLGMFRKGAYFYDTEGSFLWLNMPQLSEDTSWGDFKCTWRHELGHVYDAIENNGTERFQDGLVYYGTFCGMEIMAGAGGFLVCRAAEKLVDKKKTLEQKQEIKVSRRKFLRAVATGAATVVAIPFAYRAIMKFINDKLIEETEAIKRSELLTDEEIMAAFKFNYRENFRVT